MCTREELETHFQAAKEFRQIRGEIAALRKQGVSAGKAYRDALSSCNNPLLSRYYAPSLYAHAMNVAFEPVQTEETPALDQQQAQELQEEATATSAALPAGEPIEQEDDQTTPNPEQNNALDTLVSESSSLEVNQVEEMIPDTEVEETPIPSHEFVPAIVPDVPPDPVSPALLLGHDIKTGEAISILDSERQAGLNIVGVAGSGKSSSLENIVVTDAINGHGVYFFDKQGDSTEHILARLPHDRLSDVVLLEAGSEHNPFGINLLAHSDKGIDHDVDMSMTVIKQISGVGTDQSFWGPRLATLLRNGLYVLWYSELTLDALPVLLREKDYRSACLKNVPAEGRWVTFFFEHDFNNLSTYLQMEHSESTLNKVYQLLTIREVEYVISQKKTTIPFRQIMDESKILILKLPEHTIGEDAVSFLGILNFTSLLDAARSRADVSQEDRPFFSVVIDEFGSVASPLFHSMLPELRKYNLSFTVAYQFLGMLDEENRGATQQLTNQMSFRVRPRDAETLAHFYAKEPPAAKPRLVNKPVISPTPVDTLVLDKPHTNQFVNEFFKPWRETVKDARSHINEGSTPGSSTTIATRRGVKTYSRPGRSWSNRDEVEEAQERLDAINSLLYQVMVTKNPYQVLPISLLTFMGEQLSLPFAQGAAKITSVLTGRFLRYKTLMADYQFFVESWYGAKNVEGVAAYESVWQVLDNQLDQAFYTYEQQARIDIGEHIKSRWNWYVREYIECRNDWLRSHEHLQEQQNELRKYKIPIEDPETNSIEQYLPQGVETVIATGKPSFEQFVRDFRQVMAILATEPVMELSSILEEKPGSQRSIADMVNEMAQELIHLPNREAYVKLGVSGAESVKIHTLPLEPDCSLEELESRKRIIAENTLPYTTNRDDVEKELQQRHAAYTKSGSPQPQQQETTPKSQPTKEKTQTYYTTRRVSIAPDTLPTQQHPVVFTDEKTTGDTYLTLLYYLSHLMLQQAVRLTGKQTSINNERTKFTKLVSDSLVVSETMKESVSSGRAPLAYSLSAKGYKYLETEKGLPPQKKGDYTLHSYLVNEMLITGVLAAKTNENLKLIGFEHEKMFRQKPIQLPNGKGVEPDGLLIYQVGQNIAPIAWECDLSIETREQLIDKVQKYLQALQGAYNERCRVDALSIAFVTPNGSENDVARLVGIIEAALEHDKEAAPLFLVGAFDPLKTEPENLLFTPLFSQPFDAEKHALIETSS